MAKKKIPSEWYFYFGLAAVFILIGFFWLFNYYAQTPKYASESLQEAINNNSTKLIIHKPPFPYQAVYLVVFGAIIFLILKYKYDKEGYHVKRTRKHG